MSLILDALNRSRQDVEQVPGLATQHYAEEEEVAHRRGFLPWLGLGIALLIIVWLLLDRKSGEDVLPVVAPTPTVAPTAELPRPVTATPQVVKPAIESVSASVTSPEPPPAPEKTKDTSDKAVADLYRQSAEPPPAAQATASEQTAPAASSVSGLAAGQGKVTPAPESEPAVRNAVEEPIDIEKMVLQAREEMENASLEEHPAPFISDLSQQTKDAIPTIFYERHDYSGSPGQSSVVLNGKQVKAGASVAPGVKVEEILPDSVVLSHRGTQFRLRALNSWINL